MYIHRRNAIDFEQRLEWRSPRVGVAATVVEWVLSVARGADWAAEIAGEGGLIAGLRRGWEEGWDVRVVSEEWLRAVKGLGWEVTARLKKEIVDALERRKEMEGDLRKGSQVSTGLRKVGEVDATIKKEGGEQ